MACYSFSTITIKMQFSTVFALAAAIVGVSADVHSHCQCIHSETGYVDLVTSVKACTYVRS